MVERTVTPAASSVSDSSISLREFVEMRFKAVDARFEADGKAVTAALVAAKSAVDAALAAAQKAVDKAELAADKRFESVNEFRSALNDAARLNMPRTEAEQQIKALRELYDGLDKRLSARDERGEGKGQVWAMLAAVVAVIASVGSIIVVLAKLH